MSLCNACGMSFLKTIAILGACAMPLSGCRERSCLEKGSVQISNIVHGVNEGWCALETDGDYALFACRDATLKGIVANGVFDLTLDAPDLKISFKKDRITGQCGQKMINFSAPLYAEEIRAVQSGLRQIFRDLEMD